MNNEMNNEIKEILESIERCVERKCSYCLRLNNGIPSEDECRKYLMFDAMDAIIKLKYGDYGNEQQR